MTTWASSDLHFLHKRVREIRGFSTQEAHDETIVSNWNKLVRPDDLAWILGDLGIGDEDKILALAGRLNGRKQFITGNHDPVHPAHRSSRRHQRKWLSVFESVQAFARVNICGTDFLASHFPYSGDHTEDERYTQYRLRDEGMPLLHGHTHSSSKLLFPVTRRDIVHVGVDAWELKPVKDTQIADLVRGQE